MLELIHAGRLVLPRFQRHWVWTEPNRTAELLRSIARNWPAGNLMLHDGDGGFPSRTLEGVLRGRARRVDYSLLDGQQRLTALYQAFHGVTEKHTFFIKFGRVVEEGEFDDEAVDWLTHQQFASQYPGDGGAAQSGVITVNNLVDDGAFDRWLTLAGYDKESARRRLLDLRRRHFSGFFVYVFPAVILTRDTPREDLVRIFTTVNREGMRLSTFDLMVAHTWKAKRGRSKGFDLRQEWKDACGDPDNQSSHRSIQR